MPLFGTVFTAQPSQIRIDLQGSNILQGAAFEVAGDAASHALIENHAGRFASTTFDPQFQPNVLYVVAKTVLLLDGRRNRHGNINGNRLFGNGSRLRQKFRFPLSGGNLSSLSCLCWSHLRFGFPSCVLADLLSVHISSKRSDKAEGYRTIFLRGFADGCHKIPLSGTGCKGNMETENQVVRQMCVKNALFAIFAR